MHSKGVVSQATNCCWRAPWAILPPCTSRVAQSGRATSVEHAKQPSASCSPAPGKVPRSHRHPPTRHNMRTPASCRRTAAHNTRVPNAVSMSMTAQIFEAPECEAQLCQARLQARRRLIRATRHSFSSISWKSSICGHRGQHLLRGWRVHHSFDELNFVATISNVSAQGRADFVGGRREDPLPQAIWKTSGPFGENRTDSLTETTAAGYDGTVDHLVLPLAVVVFRIVKHFELPVKAPHCQTNCWQRMKMFSPPLSEWDETEALALEATSSPIQYLTWR